MGISGRSAGSWALIIYSALGPGALATYLQTKGQATVAATPSQVRGISDLRGQRAVCVHCVHTISQTFLCILCSLYSFSQTLTPFSLLSSPLPRLQLIHSSMPIWSAIIAVQLGLGGEDMGPMSWAGGAAVLAASVLAARFAH